MTVNITDNETTSPVYQSTEIELDNWTSFISDNDTENDVDPTNEMRQM